VNSHILPKLHERFQAILGKQAWELVPSKEENEEMNLLFHYPNAFEYSKYLQPQIEIEFGRRDQQQLRSPLSRRLSLKSFPISFGRSPRQFLSSTLNGHSGRKSRSYTPRTTVPIQPI
jgi:hypothetical protein